MSFTFTRSVSFVFLMMVAVCSASAQQAAASLTVDQNRFIFLGKDDLNLHLVWEEHPYMPIQWYVIEKSYDGNRFFAVDSIHPEKNLFDLHANNYPKEVNRFNNILYSTEVGSGRFIYNDVRGVDEAAQKNFWYRIKMVKPNGEKIYTRTEVESFEFGIADLGRLNEVDVDGSGVSQLKGKPKKENGNGTIAFRRGSGPCPDVQSPPVDYFFNGNERKFYGDCCYWIEREYQASNVYAPCGAANAWCCPRDCSPLAYDPCCFHECNEYNDCSCHPWTCCDITDFVVWVVSVSTPYTVNASITPQDISCNGLTDGVATVSPSGGISPYTYSWNNSGTGASISGLGVGTYTVTVVDSNACTTTATGTISQPSALAVTLTPDNASCFGFDDGSMTPTVSGGTPPYAYLWSNTEIVPIATVLAAGPYTVTVTDANGCVISQSANITEPPPLTSTLTFAQISCNGFSDGNLDLTVDGGSQPYTYSWNNGPNPTSEDQSGLPPGDYYVTVTDAEGCLTGAHVLLFEPDVFVGTVGITNITCYGWLTGSAMVTATGGTNPNNLIWSTGSTSHVLTGLAPGTYHVTVTDANGCSFTSSGTVTQPDEITVTSTSTNATCGVCDGTGTPVAVGGTGSFNYNWGTTPPQNTQVGTSLCAGITFLNVEDANVPGCIVSYPVSVSNDNAQPITVSSTNASCPTACDGTATVTFTNGCGLPPCDVAWFDGNGTQLNNQFGQTLSGICPGSYAVRVTNAQGCISTQNVVVDAPTNITITLNVTNQTCSSICDGTASVNPPVGGTPPYTYQWQDSTGTPIPLQTNPSISNLCPGRYKVRVLDFAGCTTIDSLVVIPYTFAVSTTATNAQCNGGCDGSIIANVTGGSTPFAYQWLDSAGNPIAGEVSRSIFNVCAGTYSVRVTSSTNCVITSDTVVITEPPADTASITSTGILCQGQCTGSATVTANGANGPYTYQWLDVDGNMIPGETNPSISNLCAGTYSAQVISVAGCVFTAGPVVISEPTPVVASTSKTDIICAGECNGSAAVSASGGTAPYTYQWYNNANVAIAGEVNTTIDSLCEAVYFVIATDANGCASVPQQVDIVPLSNVTLSLTAVDISCTDANDGTIDLVVNGAAAPLSFSWNNGAYTTQNLIGLAQGVYTVVVTDAQGCTATGNETIVNPTPVQATATVHQYAQGHVSCHDFTNGKATIVGTGGTAPYHYFWSDPDSQISETAINLPLGTYIGAVIDARGCYDSVTVTLHINPAEILTNIAVTHIICHGDSTGALDLTVTNGSPPLVYEWLPVHIVFQEDISGMVADTYSVIVTDTVNGCSVRDTAIVNQPPPISTNQSIGTCRDSFLVGGAYQTQNGIYYDTLQSRLGCDSVLITDLAFVSNFVVYDTVDICAGTSYFVGGALQTTAGTYYDTLLAAGNCDSIIVTELLLVANYAVTVDVSICDDTTHLAGGANQNITGVYIDSLLAAGGCDSIVTTNLTVYPTYNPSRTIQICAGESFLAGGALQTTSGTYFDRFTTINGCDSILTTDLIVRQPSLDTFDIQRCLGDSFFVAGAQQTQDGVYYDSLTNTAGCDSIIETTLSFVSEIIEPQAVFICIGESYRAGGEQQTEDGVYYDTTLSSGGCDSIIETTLNVMELDISLQPVGDTVAVQQGRTVTVTVTGNLNNLVYSWSPTTGLSCNDCNNVTISPVNSTSYQVVALTDDSLQCEATATIYVLVNDTLDPNAEFPIFYVPNVFTPNRDGENDEFNVFVNHYISFRLLIFDRWGTKLFETTNPNVGWDGTFLGKDLNPGVYIYYLDIAFINNEKPPEYVKYAKGSVTLLR